MAGNLPLGFKAGTAQAAFKKPGRVDLGIIFSEKPCILAALFTQNLFCAAPVEVCREILASGRDVRAIIGNSGQANACTGQKGLEDCREIQQWAAAKLDIRPDEILLISTGVIGALFDMAKWQKALPEAIANLGNADAEDFTDAIHTTDAFLKFAFREINVGGGTIRLTVMAKGAGMICPNMATMLCVCLTDAIVDSEFWKNAFAEAVGLTFNRVSVDGDTSTNDTILGLANGASGVALQAPEDRKLFQEALTEILAQTAYMLVQDGEGASKVMRITVRGAASDAEAEKVARAVGGSQLVKTAIYGGDGNWGRIICAVGYSGARAKAEDITLSLAGIERFANGQPVNDDKEKEIADALKNRDIPIVISLGNGPGEFTLLASDLGHEYVSLNSDYRS